LGIIPAFKCRYRKQLISKTAATVDGVLLEDAAQMKMDALPVFNSRTFETDNTFNNQELLCEVWFLN
jgi:hypothetical protein